MTELKVDDNNIMIVKSSSGVILIVEDSLDTIVIDMSHKEVKELISALGRIDN